MLEWTTQSFWLGVLLTTSFAAAAGFTYATLRSDGSFRFGVRTIFLIVTGICLFLGSTHYVDESDWWLSVLVFLISLPAETLLAILGLWLMICYWKRTGRVFSKTKVEPYMPPVRQTPVDVPRSDRGR